MGSPVTALRTLTRPTGETGVARLKAKIQHNLGLGLVGFAKKAARFAGSEARSRVVFRCAASLGVGVRIVGKSPSVEATDAIVRIGDDVVFNAPVTAIRLDLKPAAMLTIGEQTYVNDGVWFGCTERISIGRRVLIGPGVRFFDNAYHSIYERRTMPPSKPIVIEDDVWIASDCIILPGVTIGRGAIVGAHSVVLHDVAPFTVVAGNPALPVKQLDPQRFDVG